MHIKGKRLVKVNNTKGVEVLPGAAEWQSRKGNRRNWTPSPMQRINDLPEAKSELKENDLTIDFS